MFIETPEARCIRSDPVRTDRFVIEFADWNVWTVTDTHGHWNNRAFGLREHADMHKRGLEAYVRGDHDQAAALIDGAAQLQKADQRRATTGIYR